MTRRSSDEFAARAGQRAPRVRLARLVALTGVVAVTASVAGVAPATDAARAASASAPAGTTGGTSASGEPATLDGVSPGTYRVTLVTGDRVRLTVNRGGRFEVTVAEKAMRPDGSKPPSFHSSSRQDGVYVIPSDVRAAIRAGRVDKDLFDVEYLVEHGYTDAESERLPVIVQYENARGKGLRTQARALPASRPGPVLPSIDGAGLTVGKKRAGAFWRKVRGESGGSAKSKTALAQGVEKVWLDRKVTVNLDESAPLVGAPEAWEAGYQGAGTTVAVLDTGIDASHPDLKGAVAASRSFLSDTVEDENGHGTHVASTITGSGAASGGRYTGVAPEVELAVGKVCDAGGNCPTSAIIDGMEWAAAAGDADIVNMSIAGPPTDGTDPMSQAVNELTENTGTLFVVAAGNNALRAGDIRTPGAAEAALTVAATDKSDDLAHFSIHGPRVDGALKPDIAAPGENIAAARAAGTSMGNPLGENYTAEGGTSMAAPHVAAAAAILGGQHPNWEAKKLKAALMSTARDVGHTVYETGAGRLDVARGVSQRVFATTPNADFGLIGSDHDEALSTRIRYANDSDEPITLTLDPTLRTSAGGSVPEEALTADETVTVPAGGTASVTVTLDAARLDKPTEYTGAVTATNEARGVRLTTPVGAINRVMLTVNVLDRNGEPGANKITGPVVVPMAYGEASDTTSAASAVEPVTTAAGPSSAAASTEAGTVRFLVQPGTYTVKGMLNWNQDSIRHRALLIDPQVEVTGHTEITLDARQAEEVNFDLPRDATPRRTSFQIDQSTPSGRIATKVYGLGSAASQGRLFVTPTERVTKGTFRFSPRTTMSNPQVTMSVRSPRRFDLDTYYRAWADRGRELGSPIRGWAPFRGDSKVELVDVGFARPDDLAGLDLEGKLALLQWGDDRYGSSEPESGLWADRIHRLHEAGAAGFVAFSNPPAGYEHDSWFATPTQFVKPPREGGPSEIHLPGTGISRSQGEKLLDMLGEGPVTIETHADPNIRYTYHLRPWEKGRIPDSLTYTFGDDDLARLDANYHLSEAQQQAGFDRVRRAWNVWMPGQSFNLRSTFPSAAPKAQPVYVGPFSSDAVWDGRHIYVSGNSPGRREVSLGPRVFDRDTRSSVHSNAVPYAPGAVSMGAYRAAHPEDGLERGNCSWWRRDDAFFPQHQMTGVGGQHTRSPSSRGARLYGEDGEEIPRTPDPITGRTPIFEVPAESGTYRLVQKDEPKGVSTTWTFTSSAPDEEDSNVTNPAYGCAQPHVDDPDAEVEAEPLLFPTYDLTESLRLDNTVPAPGAHRFEVTVSNAQAVQSAASVPRIEGLQVRTSTDGGDTWQRARVVPGQSRGDGDGERTFRVVAIYPTPDRTSGTVSLEVEAWDANGNSVKQVINDAFELSHRNPQK